MALPSIGATGSIDRGIRIVVGLGLIAIALVGPKTPWGWLGLIPLITGLIGWCPAYRILGITTKKHQQG